MGVSTTNNLVSYIGDGSSTIFSFPYYFFEAADLNVYLYDINSSVIYPQTLNINYSVSGNANAQGVYPSGGNVVAASAFPNYLAMVITREPLQVQDLQLLQNQPINSLALTQQLDYLTLLIQGLQAQVNLCIQLPEGLGPAAVGQFNPVLPAGISNVNNAYAYFTVNSGANGLALLVQSTSAQAFTGVLAVANGGTGTNSIPQGTIPWMSSAIQMGGLTLIPASLGGTGLNTYNQYSLLYASSASQLGQVPSATAGMMLFAQGSSAPVFQQMNLSSSSQYQGVLPITAGGTAGSSGVQALTNLWPAGIARGDILVVNSGGLVSRFAAAASDNQVLTSNSGASNAASMLWQSPGATSFSIVTKTANYQMTSSDDFVVTNSSLFNINLPDATTCTQKLYRIMKTDSPVALVNIVASGSQTIGALGGAVTMYTQNEAWSLVPIAGQGAWAVQDHYTNTAPQFFTPTVQGAVVGSSVMTWQRAGQQMIISGYYNTTNYSNSTIAFGIPVGMVAASSYQTIFNSSLSFHYLVGQGGTSASNAFTRAYLAIGSSNTLGMSTFAQTAISTLNLQSGQTIFFAAATEVVQNLAINIGGWLQ